MSRTAAFALAVLTLLLLTLPVLAVDATTAPVASADPAASAVPSASAAPSAAPTEAVAAPVASPTPGASAAPCPNPRTTPVPTAAPGEPSPAPTPAPNLCPADLSSGDPVSLLAWVFTPVFQVLFLTMALLYHVLGDIGIAIVVTTIVLRIVLVPVFRRQIVSQRRTQLLQPELRAISAKYKGNRGKISEETLKLYRERGVSPTAGCLPGLLQLLLLLPMYSVFSQGLVAPDISSMLQILGQPVLDIACQNVGDPLKPCIDPTIRWLGNLPANQPEILFRIPGVPAFLTSGNFGISLLAVVSALLQIVQTRMMATGDRSDPTVRSMQRMFLILPLFSILYGQILPAGLFLYWIVTTVFSIVQQYLIAGWGGLFPLFGWNPSFARDHKPRFAVAAPVLAPVKVGDRQTAAPPPHRSPTDRAAGTVRPNRERGRSNRRGRRR